MSEPNVPRIVAGETAVLARRYARALYELADEGKQLDVVADDLRGLKVLVRDCAELQLVMRYPRLSRAQLVDAMKQVAATAKLDGLTGKFLMLLARNRRLQVLPAIIDAFLADLAAKRGEHIAEVSTARALTQPQKDQLLAQLSRIAGGKVFLVIKEDPSLLGGLMVKMGSRLIDASVKGKLARLERALKSQQEAA